MSLSRRAAVVVLGLLVAGWVLDGPARGDAPAAAGDPAKAPAAGVDVTVEKADGSEVEGTFGLPTVRIKSEFGAIDVDVRRLKSLAVHREGEEFIAAATLTDKTTYHGPLLTETFPITGQPAPLGPADVERIEFHHAKDTSLGAVIVGLVTLVLLEIILGVDNIIVLAIVAGRLPEEQRPRARRIGLLAALGTRLLLLATLSVLLGLTAPLFTIPPLPWFQSPEAREVSGRDLILLLGGGFLILKSVSEMHDKLEQARAPKKVGAATASFASVIALIAVYDIIFSLDSVITAVGMVDELWVMVTAVIVAMGVMLVAAEPISRFVDRRPTIKILALSFLILIGVLLVAEGLGQHFDKGYVYFAMAFAVGVEMVNLRLRGSQPQVPPELPRGVGTGEGGPAT